MIQNHIFIISLCKITYNRKFYFKNSLFLCICKYKINYLLIKYYESNTKILYIFNSFAEYAEH